ncbi:MAG: hypothetical protein ACLPKT_25260 [Methylocella sp.]
MPFVRFTRYPLAARGFQPLAQALQRYQFELSDAITLPVDQGLQSAVIELEFGAGVVVAREIQ